MLTFLKWLFTPVYLISISILNFSIYLKNITLAKISLRICIYYLISYSISKNNLEKTGIIDKEYVQAHLLTNKPKVDALDEFIYGEVPCFSFKKIINSLSLKNHSELSFLDLGCGKGKLVFCANLLFGFKAIGVDLVPTYISYANKLVASYNLAGLEFLNQDLLDIDYSCADIIHISWTCFSDTTKELITQKLKSEAKPSAYIITTSQPISHENIKLIKTLLLPLSWGQGYVYIHSLK
jgi:SAM-dependent methyltransferase